MLGTYYISTQLCVSASDAFVKVKVVLLCLPKGGAAGTVYTQILKFCWDLWSAKEKLLSDLCLRNGLENNFQKVRKQKQKPE